MTEQRKIRIEHKVLCQRVYAVAAERGKERESVRGRHILKAEFINKTEKKRINNLLSEKKAAKLEKHSSTDL